MDNESYIRFLCLAININLAHLRYEFCKALTCCCRL